jgi:GrpB-like predicted nucleotidyltransferase (UPF0157 family)
VFFCHTFCILSNEPVCQAIKEHLFSVARLFAKKRENMQKIIKIITYDAQWAQEFRRLGLPLRAALGDLAVRIDHIGSTSVPGLAAKDIIDIQVTVAALDASVLAPALAPLGYTLVEGITGDHLPPGWEGLPEEWSKLYFHAPTGQRPTHLHVRQAGWANQRYALLFRDYLRADPSVMGAYEQIKEALARLHPDDVEAYYAVKDPVCDIIMAAAERWASGTNYLPGSSDL